MAPSLGYHSTAGLLLAIAIPVGGGLFSALSMGDSVRTWYTNLLRRPRWTPPSWIFGPVWTTLYAAMGYASHRVLHLAPADMRVTPLLFYVAQLLLNFAWTPIFFRFKRFGLATVEIVALWFSICATIAVFAQHDTLAALLLVPYLGWVSYASALTFWIWRNNPDFRQRLLRSC